MSSCAMKPSLGSRPDGDQLDHRHGGGRRGPGDRAPKPAVDLQRLVGADVLLAGELAGRGVSDTHGEALDGGVQVDHVVVDRGLGVHQDLAGELPTVAQAELVEEEPHQLEVARVAHGLVVQALDPALIGLAHGAEAAGGQRRLQFDAADDDPLVLGHGRHHLADARRATPRSR